MGRDDSKRYYWLKLEKDFFKRHDIRIVESMPNGKDYILFYLKLICESTSHEGRLRFSDTIPYNEEMLATLTNTNVDIVRSAMKIFTELEMMHILDDRTIYMSQIEKMIGSESHQTRRKRESVGIPTIPSDVGKNYPKLTTEKEKELELENPPISPQKGESLEDDSISDIGSTETDDSIRKASSGKDDEDADAIRNSINAIVEYLNFRIGANYKTRSKSTASKIKARLNEGYTVDDFKKVIDTKASEWLGTDYEKYLRPETLFGNKFENYLNQKPRTRKTGNAYLDLLGEMQR